MIALWLCVCAFMCVCVCVCVQCTDVLKLTADTHYSVATGLVYVVL